MRWKRKKSIAIKALNEIASRDMTAALDLHMQELQKRSIDWKSVYAGAFSSIDNSVQGHLNHMIVGTESFPNGKVDIFDTMVMEICKIWIKMWYEQEIMKPLQVTVYLDQQ